METTSNIEKKTAVIIGAGPAGLTAAYELLRTTDIHPIILEESDSVGGISKTISHHGNRMDLGGHRFFTKNDRVMDLWRELMPVQGAPARDDRILSREKPLAKGGPDPEQEEGVMLIRERVSRIFYLRKFFDYPISLKFQTIKNLGFGRTAKAGFGYIKSSVFKKKEENLRDFMVNRFGTPLYKMFFEDYTEKVWGRNPVDISADWGAQRIKGLSLSKAVWAMLKKPFHQKKKVSDANEAIEQKNVETSLIEEFLYPKKGPGQLWELLAERVRELGGEIHLNCRVTGLDNRDGNGSRISGVLYSENGTEKRINGDWFFSTMPVKDLVAGLLQEAPAAVREITQELPYRDFITVGLLLKKINLVNETEKKTVNNIVPDCWIYVQERDVRMGRIQIFNNWSPYMVEDYQNTIFIGLEYFANEGDDLWEMPQEEFIRFAIGELCKIDIIDEADAAENVLDSVCVKVKKAYPAYFGTYSRFDEVIDYLNTYENLFCIGRNGQHRYNNMDHSMLTAMEAVRVLREAQDQPAAEDKRIIWNVNTEKEYHETKNKQSASAGN